MRVTTLFKRLLGLDGVRVVAVELEGEPGRGRVVGDLVRSPRRWLRRPRCVEDPCVWLVRDAPKTVVSGLMRVDWATVGRMLERVVAEHERTGGDRLGGLRRIGIDEVSYRKGRRYLLCVVCHDTGRIVWGAPGQSAAAP